MGLSSAEGLNTRGFLLQGRPDAPGNPVAAAQAMQDFQGQFPEADSLPLIQPSGQFAGKFPESSGDERVRQIWQGCAGNPLGFEGAVIDPFPALGIGQRLVNEERFCCKVSFSDALRYFLA
jgi:hypothetical protein